MSLPACHVYLVIIQVICRLEAWLYPRMTYAARQRVVTAKDGVQDPEPSVAFHLFDLTISLAVNLE